MSFFSYTSRTREGAIERGSIEAQDAQAARAALQEMHLDIISIEELPEGVSVVNEMETGAEGSTPPWVVTEEDVKAVSRPAAPSILQIPTLPISRKPVEYLPLTHTLRLYAGWLLAWYFLIYAFGSLQHLGRLPLEVPFLEELFMSKIILQFSAAAFLFLFLTSIHRLLRGGILKAVALGLLGVGMLVVFVGRV